MGLGHVGVGVGTCWGGVGTCWGGVGEAGYWLGGGVGWGGGALAWHHHLASCCPPALPPAGPRHPTPPGTAHAPIVYVSPPLPCPPMPAPTLLASSPLPAVREAGSFRRSSLNSTPPPSHPRTPPHLHSPPPPPHPTPAVREAGADHHLRSDPGDGPGAARGGEAGGRGHLLAHVAPLQYH